MREIATLRCLDCPQVFRVDQLRGKITGLIYDKTTVEQRNCSHERYTVDENTTTKQREHTLGGSFVRLFMGPSADGVQYNWFLVAHATCNRCAFVFFVRANYREVWFDHTKREERSSDWQPIVRRVARGEVIVNKYVPVPH
jgi:hypothetical protein